MRSLNFGFRFITVGAVVFAAACGPDGPPNLEGFGDVGGTGTDLGGDGDGAPGDGDGDGVPGDGDGWPGDGDGGPSECFAQVDLANTPEAYWSDYVDNSLPNQHAGECGPTPGPDYTMTWRAPDSRLYRAELYPEQPAMLSILYDQCDGPLLGCAGLDTYDSIDFNTEAGATYAFVIDGESPVGYFDFMLYPIDSPSGCPNGGELFDIPVTEFGSTWDGGYDFGSDCGGQDSPDRSYIFYPPVSGLYDISTVGSSFDTVLHVFDGYCGGPVLACNDDAFDVQSDVQVQLEAGVEYTVVVDGFGGSGGDYQLNIDLVGGQMNLCDNVDFLEPIVPTGAVWGAGDDASNVYQGCSFFDFERRHVWYAPQDGSYRATLDGAPGNEALAVLLGGCAGDPSMCALSDGNPVTIDFDALAGQEIVFVSEWLPVGDMSLQVEQLGNNGGPGCGDPMPEGVPSMASGTTQGAGNQYNGSCSFNPAQEAELWWTAPATGSYRISLEGSNYDTLLYVRDGGCNGPELACNDDTQMGPNVYLWSRVDLDLVQGQTISIFVDGYSGQGNYQLAITSL